MNTHFLPYGRHQIEDDDIEAVAGVLRSGSLTAGPLVGEFENAFARQVGAQHAVSCSSGTAGLHLAMKALDVGAGDGVVVPTLTFLATANAVRMVDGEVVFADCAADTGLTGTSHFAQASAGAETPCRVVVPVHLNGQCAEPEAIWRWAREHGVRVVEDACHAIGASYRTSDGEYFPVGACRHSDMTVFSLHPVKNIAMGEGGIVTTNDDELFERLKRFRNHGIVREPGSFRHTNDAFGADGAPNPWYYEMHEPGYNYRASEIHCALGLSQLRKLDRFLARRRELADAYDERLVPLAPAIQPVPRVAACKSGWHLYVVNIDFDRLGTSRADIMRRLHETGIGTQVHYLPVHRQPYYRLRYGELQCPGADSYYESCLSLPLFPAMSDADVARVVAALASVSASTVRE